jgi:hypothetical protein
MERLYLMIRPPSFVAGLDQRVGIIDSSCPALCRASTSCFLDAAKTWMAGTSPAMTAWMDQNQKPLVLSDPL